MTLTEQQLRDIAMVCGYEIKLIGNDLGDTWHVLFPDGASKTLIRWNPAESLADCAQTAIDAGIDIYWCSTFIRCFWCEPNDPNSGNSPATFTLDEEYKDHPNKTEAYKAAVINCLLAIAEAG